MLDLDTIGDTLKSSRERLASLHTELDHATYRIKEDRRTEYIRRPVAANFFLTYNRDTVAALTWYTIFNFQDAAILMDAWIYVNITSGSTAYRWWLASVPAGEVISSSLAGMNNSNRIIHAGQAAPANGGDFGPFDWGAAGLLIPAGHDLRICLEAANYRTCGRFSLSTSTPGFIHKHF